MRKHEEFQDVLPTYIAIFENCEYRTYEVSELLNQILWLYQIYYRDVFYCGLPESEAADKLLNDLRKLLDMPDADEEALTNRLQALFEAEGYHALFGKTQGYYGPYIWRETIPTVYQVELPSGTAEYTVNILKGFIFRSWMDYLTFGRYGTGGWASPDGTINCIEQAYDFESERFLVSLLKHEAQHTVDMKQFPNITPTELEYRAKLVELHYSSDLSLLQKFLSAADANKTDDGHAVAAAKIKREFADTDQRSLPCIQTRAMELFHAHTKELEGKYGKPNVVQSEMLIENIDRLHTTPMGVDRIKRNLKLDTDDVVSYCKNLILSPRCHITQQGKNWYCETRNTRVTVNSYSYTIITAHIIEEKRKATYSECGNGNLP